MKNITTTKKESLKNYSRLKKRSILKTLHKNYSYIYNNEKVIPDFVIVNPTEYGSLLH